MEKIQTNQPKNPQQNSQTNPKQINKPHKSPSPPTLLFTLLIWYYKYVVCRVHTPHPPIFGFYVAKNGATLSAVFFIVMSLVDYVHSSLA